MAQNTALRDDAHSSHGARRRRAAARNRWAAGWVLAVLLIGALVLFVDLPLARHLQANVSPSVDNTFEWIGEIGDSDNYAWIVLAVYIAALAPRLGWRLDRRL